MRWDVDRSFGQKRKTTKMLKDNIFLSKYNLNIKIQFKFYRYVKIRRAITSVLLCVFMYSTYWSRVNEIT